MWMLNRISPFSEALSPFFLTTFSSERRVILQGWQIGLSRALFDARSVKIQQDLEGSDCSLLFICHCIPMRVSEKGDVRQ